MVSKVNKRTHMYKNLQLLRSITHSHSHRKTSVLLDASKYIQGLKQNLQQMNQIASATISQKTIAYDSMPTLKVEPQEEGFMIKVLSERSCEGLLVFILEAFEELGLDVLQARVSCEGNFCLEALGIKENNQYTHHLDAQLVEQVVSQAIQNWKEITQ
ncbi:putative myc-type, basic helix-loop-helix (bHLH) domain-containing protein [Lupinus albus]|uniref:Putative myc-type, basic helix-loop-helix (BHLH) domain-containing protein n=1 Tax=Lupinus albus TaxID=3870 RepID=A0A6A4P9H1_LUPAL|nr:putative myc-type, basic helix-loop-helix (bHLH) domain-containing protein [Lupinus albus]